MKTTNIEVGKRYKYKELCTKVDSGKAKTGKSKQLQLKDWRRYFDWTNPSKQDYLITEIYDTPKEKVNNRGGARKGAGRKQIMTEEFNMLFYGFVKKLKRKDHNVIYFTRNELFKYFGIYDDVYAIKDSFLDKRYFREIFNKTSEIGRTWIINKLKREEDKYIFSYSIETTLQDKSEPEYHDELLDNWIKYQKQYLAKNNLTIDQVVPQGKYEEMMSYINGFFEEYKSTKKVCKLVLLKVPKRPAGKISEARRKINDTCINNMLTYFKEVREMCEFELEEYERVIEQYIRIEDCVRGR